MLFQELRMIVAIVQLGDSISLAARPGKSYTASPQPVPTAQPTHAWTLDLLHSANSDAFDFITRRDPMNVIF